MTECMDILDINQLYVRNNTKQSNSVYQADSFIDQYQHPQTQKKPEPSKPTYLKRPSSAKVYNQQSNPQSIKKKQIETNKNRLIKAIQQKDLAAMSLDTSYIEQQPKATGSVVSKSNYSNRSQKSRQSPRSTYVDIAYSEQIQKQQQRQRSKKRASLHSVSSSSSLDSSFEQMEIKLKKRNSRAELIDQKYMIGGYFQLVKDYKKLLLNFKHYMQQLTELLGKGMRNNQIQFLPQKVKMEENVIIEVDNYFQNNAKLLRLKVKEYQAIHQSLQRLIRMNISINYQEPYMQRVRRKAEYIEKHRGLFELIEIYLNAFDFLRNDAYSYFQKEEQLIDDLQLPPDDKRITEEFNNRVAEIREELDSTNETQEGQVLVNFFFICKQLISEVFNQKINKICEWHQKIHKILQFRYQFNVKYNLDSTSPSYKVIKSKKLYASVMEHYKEVNSYDQMIFYIISCSNFCWKIFLCLRFILECWKAYLKKLN